MYMLRLFVVVFGRYLMYLIYFWYIFSTDLVYSWYKYDEVFGRT